MKVKLFGLKILFFAFLSVFSSCTDNNDDIIITKKEEIKDNSIDGILNSLKFPESDDPRISFTEVNSRELNNIPAVDAKLLTETLDPSKAIFLTENEASDSEVNEIKEATDQIIKGAKNQTEKYQKIFKWITSNIKYGASDNSAYATFKNRKAVCQGYANLLKLMCYTQKIPAFVVGGFLYVNGKQIGGHAWNYVNTDGIWRVSDPTNNHEYKMSDLPKYQHELVPLVFYINLYENNDFTIGFKDSKLSLIEIKNKAPNRFFVPYSYQGFKISSFDPDKLIPSNVNEVIFNKNISSIGNIKNSVSGLVNSHNGKNLKAIYIVKENPFFESDGSVIFNKSSKELIFPLETTEEITLKAGTDFGKNIIFGLKNLKKITFPTSAKVIESYAIEDCPSLIEVTIPKGCKYEVDSFYKCNPNLKIITAK